MRDYFVFRAIWQIYSSLFNPRILLLLGLFALHGIFTDPELCREFTQKHGNPLGLCTFDGTNK
jgi:hypothetical protein